MIDPINYQTDYIFNYVSTDKINEIIDSLNTGEFSGYNTEGSFTSLVNQTGQTDVPQAVSYGPTKDSDNSHISYNDTTKDFTINTTGYYSIKTRLRFGRTGAAGVSNIMNWAEVSVDGGSNWSVLGNAIEISLDSSIDKEIFLDSSQIYFPAGVKLRSMFARSSTGDDSGDLVTFTPSAALTTYGLQPSASAQSTIYKIGG